MRYTIEPGKRADSLQFLRFLAFLIIFLLHGVMWVSEKLPLANAGAAAVSFFILLSGFGAGWSAYEKEVVCTPKAIGKNVFAKLRRFYPLYLATTLYTVLYTDLKANLAAHAWESVKGPAHQLVKNLLLIQTWFPRGFFTYNIPGWFLSTLMLLVVLQIPFTALGTKIKKRDDAKKCFALIFVGILVLTVFMCYFMGRFDVEFWEYVFPPSRVGEYAMGMTLAYLIRLFGDPERSEKEGNKKASVLMFTILEAAALCVCVIFWYFPVSVWDYRIARWLFPNLLLLAAFAPGCGWISKLFSTKLLKGLGDRSFEYYLIHYLFIYEFITHEGSGGGSTAGNLFSLGFCLILTLLFGEVLYPKKRK